MKSDEYNENFAMAWACLDTGQSGLPVQKSIKYYPELKAGADV